jgi:hypothetical protein
MTDVLADYKLHYEDIPRKKYQLIKQGDSKMSKEVKQAKTRKVYSKTRSEHYKDVLIAVLITAIVAFVAGLQAQAKQQQAIDQAVQSVAVPASAEDATELK